MRTPLKLIFKANLSVFFVSVFAFSLLFASLIISYSLNHIYLEEVSKSADDAKTSFITAAQNAATINIPYKLVLVITISGLGRALQHIYDLATLSRAPPYNFLYQQLPINNH